MTSSLDRKDWKEGVNRTPFSKTAGDLNNILPNPSNQNQKPKQDNKIVKNFNDPHNRKISYHVGKDGKIRNSNGDIVNLNIRETTQFAGNHNTYLNTTSVI